MCLWARETAHGNGLDTPLHLHTSTPLGPDSHWAATVVRVLDGRQAPERALAVAYTSSTQRICQTRTAGQRRPGQRDGGGDGGGGAGRRTGQFSRRARQRKRERLLSSGRFSLEGIRRVAQRSSYFQNQRSQR